MEVVVKKKVVRNECIEVSSEKLKLNLTSDSVRGLEINPHFGEVFEGRFVFFDYDLGDVEISFKPHASFQEENVKELLLEITKLIKEVI